MGKFSGAHEVAARNAHAELGAKLEGAALCLDEGTAPYDNLEQQRGLRTRPDTIEEHLESCLGSNVNGLHVRSVLNHEARDNVVEVGLDVRIVR